MHSETTTTTTRREEDVIPHYPAARTTTKKSTATTVVANNREAAKQQQQQLHNNQRQRACRHMKTVRDIQTCYPADMVRPLDSSCQEDVVDSWPTLQRCLMGQRTTLQKKNNNNTDPFVIHIIGERHSGTKFVMRELQQCFLAKKRGNTTTVPVKVAKVHRDFLRVKHFFQPILRGGGDFSRHIVVVAVRNPVDWVAAMHAKPYHSPGHIAGFSSNINNNAEVIPLSWQDFVSRPWTTHRSQIDAQLRNQSNARELHYKPQCQEGFAFDQVVPCQMDNVSYPYIPPTRLRGFAPLYELQQHTARQQQPYQHILQLRADKITNFCLQLPLLYPNLGGFVVVRYEDLLLHGTRQVLLEPVADLVGLPSELPPQCRPTPPQPKRLRQRAVPPDFRQWIVNHLDADRERLLGYYP